MRKYNWKKIIVRTLWLIAGIGTIVLFGAAMQTKNHKNCEDVKIEIRGAAKHMFIDEKDVKDMLVSTGFVTGKPIASLDLRFMETIVEKNPWVRNAEMFLDNNRVLQVMIDERQPVARVFAMDGNSFYLDSNALRLPLSEKLSARVPVFTGFPSSKAILAKPDSALLFNVVKLGRYIMADSFWMAQVAQVDITPQSTFEMIPVIGNHLVVLGDAEDIDKKFHRLYTFYQQAWLENGMETYEKLDVQYDKQIVAVRKGATKAWIDSARAREAIKSLLDKAKAGLADSTSHVSVPVHIAAAPTKDTAKATKTNSAGVINNKAAIKPLTKGKKPVLKKKKTTKPKALMGRTEAG